MSKANLAWPCAGALLSIATPASAAPGIEILIGDARMETCWSTCGC
jgi:hypothetical protein